MTQMDEQFTLLLVDDNPTNLTLLAKIVEFDLPQVRVLTASDAVAGLQLAQREQIDGAFIDVQMPRMNGLDMCRKLKADPRTAHIPLVLITAHLAAPEMRAEGLEVGAYDFISQPISNIEMLARIKVMLRLAENEQLLRQDRQQLQQQVVEHSAQLRWVSGLLLSGEGPLAEPDQQLIRRLASELPAPAELTEQQLLETLVNDFPPAWRRTLLKLALLEEIPLPLAQKLSEIADIEAVFAYLQRQNLSLLPTLSGHEQLRLKPQVQQALRERAETFFTQSERLQVFRLAADWYQQQGQLPAAFGCLLQAADYPAISQLLSQCELALLCADHRPQLARLLAELPDEVAAGCGWMALYKGASYLHQWSSEADTWLELACTRFAATQDQRGQLLGGGLQLLHSLLCFGNYPLARQRLALFRTLAAQTELLLEPLSRVKVQYVLGLAELQLNADFGAVEASLEQALPEALQQSLTEVQLELYLLRSLLAIQQGRYRVAWATLEQARNCAADLPCDIMEVQLLGVVSAKLLFATGDLQGFERQLLCLEEHWGVEWLREATFGVCIYFWAALAALARGKVTKAHEQLDGALLLSRSACQPALQGGLLQLRAWLAAKQGEASQALTDCERALALQRQAEGPVAGLVGLLLAGVTFLELDDTAHARQYLEEGLERSLAQAEEYCRGGFYAWLAVLERRQGNMAKACELFGRLVELLRRQQQPFFFALTPAIIEELLPLGEHDDAWHTVCERLAVSWLDAGLTAAARPVPQLQVQVLGGFSLRCGDQVFRLSEVGQPSRQILAMLTVAPSHSMSIELIMGRLWPDSSPTKARSSFDTAHSRLRKALENVFGDRVRHDYLSLEKGMLSLRHVAIDSANFQATVERARYRLQRQHFWRAELALGRAQDYWRGEFLSGYEVDGELLLHREHLTQLRLEQVAQLARLWHRNRDHAAAVRLLQEGLLLEPTHDPLVQQLLGLHRDSNDKRQARQVLESYRQALRSADYDEDEIEELIEELGPQRYELEQVD